MGLLKWHDMTTVYDFASLFYKTKLSFYSTVLIFEFLAFSCICPILSKLPIFAQYLLRDSFVFVIEISTLC